MIKFKFKFKIFSALIILIQFNNLQKQTNNCIYMIEPGAWPQVIILLNEGGGGGGLKIQNARMSYCKGL